MGIATMRPTILIAALMVVTVVVFASTTNSVQSVNATLEILVSATVGLFANKIPANIKWKITIKLFKWWKYFKIIVIANINCKPLVLAHILIPTLIGTNNSSTWDSKAYLAINFRYYSRVPYKQRGRILENEKKSHLRLSIFSKKSHSKRFKKGVANIIVYC